MNIRFGGSIVLKNTQLGDLLDRPVAAFFPDEVRTTLSRDIYSRFETLHGKNFSYERRCDEMSRDLDCVLLTDTKPGDNFTHAKELGHLVDTLSRAILGIADLTDEDEARLIAARAQTKALLESIQSGEPVQEKVVIDFGPKPLDETA